MTNSGSKSKVERPRHIQYRSGKPYVVIRERYDRNRPSKVVWHGPFVSLDEAITFRDQRRKELAEGTAREKSALTLSEYLREWLTDHAVTKPLKRSTAASYSEKIKNYVDPTIGQMTLQAIKPHHLKSWVADLMRDGGAGGKGLSRATVRKVGVIVKGALVAAMDEYGYISVNPAANLKLPTAERGTGAIWTVAEARSFASAAANSRLATLFAVLIATGARRGEVLALTWDDVDIDAGSVVISKSATWVDGVRTIETTKTNKVRVVDVDPATMIALRKHRAQQVQERLGCDQWQEHNLVFCRPNGSPLPPDFAYRQFQRLIKEAGVSRIRLHDLRHTHATWLLEAGEQLHVVADRLGHADSSTTSNIYAHVTDRQRRKGAETFRRIMDGK